jgi:hypothetical protein
MWVLTKMNVCTIAQALEQAQDFGLHVSHLEVDSATIRRCRFEQKKKLNGFYRIYSIPGTTFVAGIYGTFYPDYQILRFQSEVQAPTLTDSQRFMIKKKQEETKKMVDSSYDPDLTIWDMAKECVSHPYLTKKGVGAHGIKEIKGKSGKEALVPMRNKDGELVGLQRVLGDGTKLMVRGSKKKGAFHKIDGSDVIAICEGYATGATIHEATGWTVIIAFDCGNLKPVARHFKLEKLIICGDDDWSNPENPGKTKANEICEKYGCPAIFPVFDDAMANGTDFNDLGKKKTAEQLEGKAPKSFIEQCSEIEGPLDDFLMSKKSYLAEYPKAEFSTLKNTMKRKFDVAKGFMDDLVHGIRSEEDIEKINEAKEELQTVRYDGKTYCKLILSTDGDKYYRTTQQEVTLLLNVAGGDDGGHKQKMLDEIHRDRVVSEVSAEPQLIGRSRIKEFLGPDGTLIVKKMVSSEKVIESRLAELDEIVVDDRFIDYVKKNYTEVIEIMEAALARKFCESKKSFVYLRCPTHFGKTFFFGLESLGRSFTKRYDKEEFRGNSPEDFVKPIYLFVDEASCFPSEYKVNEPEYKRLYGGFAKVKLGLRILACANPMEDLENGVDPQIRERVVFVHPKPIRLEHHGIEKTLSRLMWEKWILNRLGNLILKWSQEKNPIEACEKHFDGFLERYKSEDNCISLDEVMKDCLEELLNGGEEVYGANSHFPFFDYLIAVEGGYFISSPKRFFKELFIHFDEGRLKAFQSQFGSNESFGKSGYLFEFKAYKINGKTRKGVTFLTEVFSDGNSDFIKMLPKKVTVT